MEYRKLLIVNFYVNNAQLNCTHSVKKKKKTKKSAEFFFRKWCWYGLYIGVLNVTSSRKTSIDLFQNSASVVGDFGATTGSPESYVSRRERIRSRVFGCILLSLSRGKHNG